MSTETEETVDKIVSRFNTYLTNLYSTEEVRGLIMDTSILGVLRLLDEKKAQWFVLAHRVLRAEMEGSAVLVAKRWGELTLFEGQE